MRMHWVHPLLLLLFALPAHAQTLDLLAYPNQGVFDAAPGGKVSGSGTVVLKHLAEVTGIELRVRVVPAARALLMINQQPSHCAVGVPRTPERESQFRWAGLIASGALVLYGRAGETREVDGAQALRGTVTVAQRESLPMAWLRERGLSVYEVGDTVTGLRMLRAGRVDYWLVNDLAAQAAIQGSDGARPKLLHNFGQIDLYVACHHDVTAPLAERLSRGFEQLRRNGELAAFGLR